MKNEYVALEDLVRTRYASVAWTHKIQEKQAEIYDKRYRILATVNIFAASITSAGIFSLIFTDQTWLKIASAVVSFVTIFISALLKSFDLQSMTKANKETATKLVELRDELQTLILKIKLGEQSVYSLTDEFESLQKRVHAVYSDAPKTTDAAVKMAEVALKVNGDNTFTEKEIDMMLPATLKRRGNDE